MKEELSFYKKRELAKIYYLVLYLMIYSFIGWLLETAFAFYETGHFVKRGFLFGPICPIYGWGAIILFSFLKKYKKNSLKMFFVCAIVFSFFEYIVSFSMEALFASKWWDYSNEVLNLNGRISIFFSFVWGIFGILFINHIHPFINKYSNKILRKTPYFIKTNLIQILGILYISDTLFSMIKYFIKK